MILIKNTQSAATIDTAAVKKDTQKLLTFLGYEDFDICIWFTTNKTIGRYNKQYRDINKATDILSFPYHPDLEPGERILPSTPDDKNLGDIIMAPEYIHNTLEKWDTTFEKHLRTLLAHGICHLLGYTHETDDDYEIMQEQEKLLLKQL